MFSESELVFLAFVFIATLGCFMLGRRRRDSPSSKKAKQEEKQTSKL